MSNTGIGRASAILASGTVVSRILGFVKAIVLAQTIGLIGSGADAFAFSTIVPNSIYAIIAGGLLSAILVPQIVRASVAPDGGQAYINKLLTIAIIAFAVITVIITFAAPALISLYASRSGAETVRLATAFAYWGLPQVFFLGLYSVLGEVLNARRVFGPFTWAPVFNNVIGIGILVLFVALYGADGSGSRAVDDWSGGMVGLLAGGTTLGIAVQASILFLFWRRSGLRFRPDFKWRGVNLGVAGKAAGWTFGMVILSQVAGLVETNVVAIASGKAAGAFTLSQAWLIFMLPHSVITVSIVTAFYTRMSEHAAVSDIGALRADVSRAVRSSALIIVIAAAAIIVAAVPIARVFTDDLSDAQQMAGVITAYLVGLVPFCIQFVIQRCFYALGDTRTPFAFTAFQVVLVIALALLASLLPVGLIAVGIAAAVSIAGTAQLVVSSILLRRRIGDFGVSGILASIGRYLLGAAIAAVAGYFVLHALGGFDNGFAVSGQLAAIVSVAVTGTAMLAVYAAILAILRSPELQSFASPILSRLRRS